MRGSPLARDSSGAPSPYSTDSSEEDIQDFSSLEIIAAPRPSIRTSAGNLSPIDLRMIHHWSIVTAQCTAVGKGANTALQTAVPQLAFENDFLLNTIMGIATLHVQQTVGGIPEFQKRIDVYRVKAMAGYREALAKIQPETTTFESALISSILLVILWSRSRLMEEGELIVTNWFLLYQGISFLAKSRKVPSVEGLSVSPVFKRQWSELLVTPAIPRVLLEMLQEITPMDSDYPYLEYYCTMLDALGNLYGSLKQDGLTDNLYVRIISWPSLAPVGFNNRARAQNPRALVILAHYLTFVKLAKHIWWTVGIPDTDIDTIAELLGPLWLPFLAVPIEARMMSKSEDIATLLLR